MKIHFLWDKIIKSKNIGYIKLKQNIQEGYHFKKNEILATITAMNIDNYLKAPENGTIKKILVKNNTPVEYSQPIFEWE